MRMPGRLNRLLLTTDAVGGIWRYTLDLASGLSERGIDCVIAVLGPPPDAAQSAEATAIRGVTLVRTGQPLDWTAETPEALLKAAERVATIAALMGAQSVHLHTPALLGEAAWPAPVLAVHHSCVGTWWRAMRPGPPPPDFAWRIAATASGLHRARAVIAPTQAHADAIQAVYGPFAIAVVHNGAAPPPPPMPPNRRERAVLTAGRLWDEAKGVASLDAAAATLDAPIRAAGPTQGPNGARIETTNLTLLGPLDRQAMAAAYAGASVFCSMAAYEPFGLAVLEAALAGLRLVLADTPVFRELWDGAANFVSDPADLVPALRAALDTTGDAREAARRFTLEKMVANTLALHRELQKPSPSGRGIGGAGQASADHPGSWDARGEQDRTARTEAATP
jgi:glycosyltransferase involved in cell wall biosynthesis